MPSPRRHASFISSPSFQIFSPNPHPFLFCTSLVILLALFILILIARTVHLASSHYAVLWALRNVISKVNVYICVTGWKHNCCSIVTVISVNGSRQWIHVNCEFYAFLKFTWVFLSYALFRKLCLHRLCSEISPVFFWNRALLVRNIIILNNKNNNSNNNNNNNFINWPSVVYIFIFWDFLCLTSYGVYKFFFHSPSLPKESYYTSKSKLRYDIKIDKSTYVYGSILYTQYNSYMFRLLIWPSSGRWITKDRYIETS